MNFLAVWRKSTPSCLMEKTKPCWIIFFEDNKQYEEDLKEIASKLVSMGNTTGCRIQYFKENEGAPGDGVVAL